MTRREWYPLWSNQRRKKLVPPYRLTGVSMDDGSVENFKFREGVGDRKMEQVKGPIAQDRKRKKESKKK